MNEQHALSGSGTSKSRAMLMFILVALFLFYEMAVQVSPSVISPYLVKDLKIDAFVLGLISGVYFYTYTFMQIPAGLMYDRFNIRPMIIYPLLLCIIGTFLFGIANSVLTASLARLLMGAGSAFAFIGVLTVAADVFPKKHFALAVGVTQMLAAIGAMFGGLPLLPIIGAVGWRNTLFIIAGIGLVLGVFIWFFVHYKRPLPDKTETALSMLHSLKSILKNRQSWFIALYACMLWAPMSAFASLWGIPYLAESYNIHISSSASLVALMWIGIAIASPLVGAWSDRIGKIKLPLMVCALVGLLSFTLVLLPLRLPFVILGIMIFLAGSACAGQALSFALVRHLHTAENRSAAIGFNNMAVVISGAIFQPLIGKIIDWHSSGVLNTDGTPMYMAGDYRSGLMLLFFVYAVGLVVSFVFIKDKSVSSQ